jgi:hypothetical protein
MTTYVIRAAHPRPMPRRWIMETIGFRRYTRIRARMRGGKMIPMGLNRYRHSR